MQILNMIKGCRIRDPSLLYEGYARTESGYYANVNAEKMQTLLERFVKLHDEWCFVILEVPTKADEETALTSDGSEPLHKDVYYLDGLTPESAVSFLRVYGEWFVHDGLTNFGFGIHSGGNEIILEKYNVVTVYTKTPRKYDGFFEEQGIFEVPDLKTAWKFFTVDSPGESFRYRHQGKDVYDLIAQLKQYGLYFAERREA